MPTDGTCTRIDGREVCRDALSLGATAVSSLDVFRLDSGGAYSIQISAVLL